MEETHISQLRIQGFKKFDDLEVENIGQFNLIIGDNNVGKTSLLEALLAETSNKFFFESLGAINFGIRNFNKLSSSFINLYFKGLDLNFPKTFDIQLLTKSNSSRIQLIAFDENKFHLNGFDFQESDSIYNIRNKDYENFPFDINVPFIPMGSLYTHELTILYSKSIDRKSTRLNSSHRNTSRMPSSA